MDIQQRISQQRISHIIDSYRLMGADDRANGFDAYVELLSQYPHGLIELALVETLAKSWLAIPMNKGVAFLAAAHERIKQWQLKTLHSNTLTVGLTPSQFLQITGLDPQLAFSALTIPVDHPTALPSQAAVD